MKTVGEAFCLENGRQNFQINVRESPQDRKVYFGRGELDNQLIDDIVRRYVMGLPPKKYIYGLYGAGKTHTLFNIKYRLEEDPSELPSELNIRCRFIEAEFRKKTDFAYLHRQMMEGIGMQRVKKVVQNYIQQHATENVEELLHSEFNDANIARAIHSLGVGAQDVEVWKWLSGGSLTSSDLSARGLTKNMDTVVEMTSALTGICGLFKKKNVHYLFLLDELEGAQNVTNDDAQRSIHDAFRKLAEDSNGSVGYIGAIYGGKEQDLPHFLVEEDIINRMGRPHLHELQPLSEPGDVETFMDELFNLLVDQEKLSRAVDDGDIDRKFDKYPFTDEAFEQFVDAAVTAPHASLPRNLIRAVNECAFEALKRDSRVIEPQDLGPTDSIFIAEY